MRWCSVINPWNYRSMHSHANVNTQLVETRKTCLFFLSIQIYWVSTWAPNWEYSSEHDGAYHPAASESITSIILTLLLQHVLWNRPGAKRRFSRKSWPTSRNQTSDEVSVRKKHLGLARWEMEESCKQREDLSALTREDIYWTENQPVWLQRGNEDGVMPGRGWFLQGV